MKTPHLLATVAVLALVAGLAGYQFSKPDAAPAPAQGYQVLKLKLADADGKPQPMAQWDDRILVINYWATWCPPCLEEMPAFSRLHDKYSAKGVTFVGIGIDVPDKIRHYRDSAKISYPLLVGGMDVAGTGAELGNKHQALPFTAVFNRQRELIAVKLGRWMEADLEREIQAALAR